MAPADVVKAGAAAGLKFSRNLVYEVRARLKNGPKKKTKKAGKKTSVAKRRLPTKQRKAPAPRKASAAAPAAAHDERAFLRIALDLGLGRARELLGEFERRITALVRG